MTALAATLDILAAVALGVLGLIALVGAVCSAFGRPTGQGRDDMPPEED